MSRASIGWPTATGAATTGSTSRPPPPSWSARAASARAMPGERTDDRRDDGDPRHGSHAARRRALPLPVAEDGSKRPAVDWKQYQTERPTEAQIDEWFG